MNTCAWPLLFLPLLAFGQADTPENRMPFGVRFYNHRPCGGCPMNGTDTLRKVINPYSFADEQPIVLDSLPPSLMMWPAIREEELILP